MRKLTTDDMFILSEIADKMDITINAKGKTQEEMGAELLLFLIKKAHKAKNEIKTLVSRLTEKSEEEVAQMSPKQLINAVSEILKQDGVLDFFK